MGKPLLHPPETVHSFTFHGGCGKPHEYDGVHGVDCAPCVEVVRVMSPTERIAHPHLRAPLTVTGDTPAEVDTMRRVEEARRLAASWRLVEAGAAGVPVAAGADESAPLLRLREEVA